MAIDPIFQMCAAALAAGGVLYLIHRYDERRWARQARDFERAKADWDAAHPAE